MKELQCINSTEIEIKEYGGQRVVTFRDIDAVHGRPDGTARKRFNDNRDRFVAGEDYFTLNQPSEIRTLGIERPQGGLPENLTLITESGYLMLVKSFTDDLAWKVQRELVNSYFRGKDRKPPAPLTPAEQLLAQASLLVEQEKRLAAVEQKQRQMGSAVKSAFETLAAPAADRDQWQEEMNRKIRQMCLENGLNYQTTIGEMYRELEETAGVNLTTRQKRLRERMKRGGAKYAECAGVSKLLVVSQDKKLREIYSGIVRARAAGLIAARSF